MARSRRLDLRRPPTVVVRPLGRERALGLAHVCPSAPDQLGKIEIDPRQSGRRLLETIIHELLHQIFPTMMEEDIRRAGRYTALCLWAWGVRIDEERFCALAQGGGDEAV